MEQNISIVNLSQGPHKFDPEEWHKADKNRVKVHVTPAVRCSAADDYIGVQFDIRLFDSDDETRTFYTTGFLIGILVDGWAETVKSTPDVAELRQAFAPVYRQVWLAATGVVAAQTTVRGTGMVILPDFNPAMCDNLNFNPWPSTYGNPQ